MELNSYQKKVIENLKEYLQILDETNNLETAWSKYWENQDVQVGANGVPHYNNIIAQTPHISFKVPTGGGKTFLACSSIKLISDELPVEKPKVVVWLVPSDAILDQTVSSLMDTNHPYRKKLNLDFGGNVGIYTKDQLINGENFSPDTVKEMLTICILSYSSLRIGKTKKDARKVYQENGNLLNFGKNFGSEDVLLADTPDTALIQVLRKLSPITIVDESHNAGSSLSIDMLNNLNPSFVLDLTATPRENSNVISYVDARELKKENMVKLPVVVYNRFNRNDVIKDAIQLRANLEKEAILERKNTNGRYIRPIVLFQAQPKTNEDSDTFEKIKKLLVEIGISPEEIAIKTSNIDEIKNVDLMSEECPIKYIITVNALKEGWDCSFAYILASLANKTSSIDVEQIVGRILRQPYAEKNSSPLLNTSYVLTCSKDFHATLDNIIKGLNNAGFSKKDSRVAEESSHLYDEKDDVKTEDRNLFDMLGYSSEQNEINNDVLSEKNNQAANLKNDVNESENDVNESENDVNESENDVNESENDVNESENDVNESENNAFSTEDISEYDSLNKSTLNSSSDSALTSEELDDFSDLDTDKIKNDVSNESIQGSNDLNEMVQDAIKQNENYEVEEESTKSSAYIGGEIGEMLNQFEIQPHFQEKIKEVLIPQFFIKIKPDLFGEELSLISPENLSEGFSLKDLDANVNFELSTGEMYEVDVDEKGEAIPKYKKLSRHEVEYIRNFLANLPTESILSKCTKLICDYINKHDQYSPEDIRKYVERILSNMKEDELIAIATAFQIYASKIQDKIQSLEAEYREKQFYKWLDAGKVQVKKSYKFPSVITPSKSIDAIPKSLYEAERDDLNKFERKVIDYIVSLDNIVWWHRVIDRKGFKINGFINHYPDFILKTKSGKIILIETKGDYLAGEDSARKLQLGRSWAANAGSSYKYFMVFENKQVSQDGAYNLESFIDVISNID